MTTRQFKWRYFLLLAISLILAACVKENPYEQGQAAFSHQHYNEAFEKLLSPAIHGEARSQYAVGYMYYYGLGVAKDEDMARHWLRKSAKIGYPMAQHALELLSARDYPEHQPLPINETVEVAIAKKPYQNSATELISDNYAKDLDWIREQNPTNYTLLLATTTSESRAKRERKQYYGQQRLAQYRYLRQGKTWYGTVYGQFANEQQAYKVQQQLAKNKRLSIRVIEWQQVQSSMLP